MADEKKQKQGGQKPQGSQAKPPGKKAKPEQAEAAGETSTGKPARPRATNRATARLRERYYKEVLPALMKELSLDNPMAAPKLEKIVVNMGVGEATQNAKVMDPAVAEVGQITGQKPVITKARKSIAAFKVREGMPIGVMVTLRGDRMYEFFDRLVNVALPRVRDFRGVPTRSFDGRGNYTLGVRDQLIFPEIDYSKVEKLKGMNITIVTTAGSDDQARALLKHMGMPFRQ
ncbi:MAG TPA: 50S ribosomal protein L5 [Terriglobales bacterium]|nr:50S ribosomal protein L5 [Terriglobales bacterium]